MPIWSAKKGGGSNDCFFSSSIGSSSSSYDMKLNPSKNRQQTDVFRMPVPIFIAGDPGEGRGLTKAPQICNTYLKDLKRKVGE